MASTPLSVIDGVIIQITSRAQLLELVRASGAVLEKPTCGSSQDRLGRVLGEICIPAEEEPRGTVVSF